MAEYAHEVAPDVDGYEYIGDTEAKPGTAQRKMAYHAARAHGYFAGYRASGMRWGEGLLHALASYEMAWLYSILATLPDDTGDDAAADIAGRLASPQVIEPDIAEMLRAHNIDAASIKPYEPKGQANG